MDIAFKLIQTGKIHVNYNSRIYNNTNKAIRLVFTLDFG